MWKAIFLAALIVLAAERSGAQAACPVTWIGGDADRDSIKLSFMNKGKIPIQQLVLACNPPLDGKKNGAACHTESGIFYPGTEYSFDVLYPGASGHTVTISLKTAVLAGGIMWNSTPGQACRALKVPRKK